MRLNALLSKELREIVRNKLLLFTIVIPPVLFALLPIIMIFAAQADPVSPQELEILYRMDPATRGLDPVSATQVLLLNQFNLIFLMIPAIVPMVIASFSIIGEKQGRSLEPLLATPLRVWELLLAKALGAVIPAVLATWAGYGVAVVGVAVFGTPVTLQAALHPIWLLSLLTLAPLLSLAAVGLAVIVSSRVNDTRVAQQASLVLVLPILGLLFAQLAGVVLISPTVVLLAALGLLLIDAALLYAAVRLFRREAILTEWR